MTEKNNPTIPPVVNPETPAEATTPNAAPVSTATPAAATGAEHKTVRRLPPPNYMWLSVVFLLCCCSPFGLISLFYGIRTNRAFLAGEDETAEQASSRALLWCWLSVLWVIFLTFWAMFFAQKLQALYDSWQ